MTCGDLAMEIMKKYDSNMYTQEQLAEEYNIPIEVIRQLTQFFLYKNTKRELRKDIFFEEEVAFLQPYVNK